MHLLFKHNLLCLAALSPSPLRYCPPLLAFRFKVFNGQLSFKSMNLLSISKEKPCQCALSNLLLLRVHVLFLPGVLRVLHWYITRIYLPRSYDKDILFPLDVWILSNALRRVQLSLPRLIFHYILEAVSLPFQGGLPFAPLLTAILERVGVNLRDHVLHAPSHSLKAQHVLRLLHCGRAPFQPTQGGEPVSLNVCARIASQAMPSNAFCCEANAVVIGLTGFDVL
ncbi:hypothetical protein LINPERHAP1_LOCUS7412 [Linum perenne]